MDVSSDEVWAAAEKAMNDPHWGAQMVSINQSSVRRWPKGQTSAHAKFIFDTAAHRFAFENGTVDGVPVGPEHQIIATFLQDLNSDHPASYTAVVKTDRKLLINGREMIAFDFKKEYQPSNSSDWFTFVEGTAWVDPLAKVCLFMESRTTLGKE